MSAPGERILGSYRLLERIGKGGMGVVYRAQHRKLGREAAVKVLPTAMADDEDFLRRFEREAASAASLSHPHILPIWDYGDEGGLPYLVMPLVRGGTLKDRLERGPLPRDEFMHYLGQIAEALDFAHARGIIHRDVKPANMLLDEWGRLYLADFGIAKALAGGEGLTRSGVGVGTPEYMAPEQAHGRADPRSDVYALGIVAYQMLTGQVPYTGTSALEVLMKHLQEPLPLAPLRTMTPPPPADTERVLQKALAKNPDERYQTGRELVEAFAAAARAGSGAATLAAIPPPSWGSPPTTPPPTPAARASGGGYLPLLIGGVIALVALLLLGGAGAYALVGRGGMARPTAGPTATGGVIALATGTVVGTATATTNPPTATAPPTATPTALPTATVAPTPTATPPPRPSGAIPEGWQVYEGTIATLPMVLAYPPGWTVQDEKGKVIFTAADGLASITFLSDGTRSASSNIDVLRDQQFLLTKNRTCAGGAGDEGTRTITRSGLTFAEIRAACNFVPNPGDRPILFALYSGYGLNDGVLWNYSIVTPYANFDDNLRQSFEPMLQTLNIYRNPTR